MTNAFSFVEAISALAPPARIRFYTLLAQAMTMAIRAAWTDPALPPEQQLHQIQWLNEIAYRALERARQLQAGDTTTEAATWAYLKAILRHIPQQTSAVMAAITASYHTSSAL